MHARLAGSLAENLQDGATAEALQAICESSILAGFKQLNRLVVLVGIEVTR